MVISFAFLVCEFILASCSSQTKVLGDESVVTTPSVEVSQALLTINYERDIRVKGRVVAVCPDDGCWIALSDVANILRVEFNEEKFTVSRSLFGSEVVAEGKVIKKVISKNSPGYDEYQKSCGMYGDTSRSAQQVPVFVAHRIELK